MKWVRCLSRRRIKPISFHIADDRNNEYAIGVLSPLSREVVNRLRLHSF